MALPTVVINSSGSNTLASGAGPATAVTGTAAATHSNTTVNITDAVALGGVATDGSAVLWVNSSSGRQFSKITAITGSSGAWVVTVSNAYGVTDAADSWAIGGKRATMAGSTQLFSDWQLGWTVDVQTGETTSASIVLTPPTTDGQTSPPILTSTTYTTWGTQPIIQTATNSTALFKLVGGSGLIIQNLYFKCTAGTPGDGFDPNSGSTVNDIEWINCIFDGWALAINFNASNAILVNGGLEHCEVKNCTWNSGSHLGAVVLHGNGSGTSSLVNCYFHDNKQVALLDSSVNVIEGCVFANNISTGGQSAIEMSVYANVIRNNTFYNTGNGTSNGCWLISFGGGTVSTIIHESNLYYGNPGYGPAVNSSGQPATWLNRNNAYGSNNGNNTGLNRSGVPVGMGDVALTANPFVSTVTPDYGLNGTAGGGTACKAAASTVPNASANGAGDIGAIPSGGGGSGGGTAPVAYGGNFRGGFCNG